MFVSFIFSRIDNKKQLIDVVLHISKAKKKQEGTTLAIAAVFIAAFVGSPMVLFKQ